MSTTTTEYNIDKWFSSDIQFHQLYPVSMQLLARKHWTPLPIIRIAAKFLAPERGVKVLDIGSGIGKFCLSAAYHQPQAHFTGIEQRRNLVMHADTARRKLGLENADFLHGNFTQLNFAAYDHFYFFNSFYENLAGTHKIDETIDYSNELYFYYSHYMQQKLGEMPAGTRLVSFHSLENEIPESFKPVALYAGNLLKCWIKK